MRKKLFVVTWKGCGPLCSWILAASAKSAVAKVRRNRRAGVVLLNVKAVPAC